jgi:hypothetical protein
MAGKDKEKESVKESPHPVAHPMTKGRATLAAERLGYQGGQQHRQASQAPSAYTTTSAEDGNRMALSTEKYMHRSQAESVNEAVSRFQEACRKAYHVGEASPADARNFERQGGDVAPDETRQERDDQNRHRTPSEQMRDADKKGGSDDEYRTERLMEPMAAHDKDKAEQARSTGIVLRAQARESAQMSAINEAAAVLRQGWMRR